MAVWQSSPSQWAGHGGTLPLIPSFPGHRWVSQQFACPVFRTGPAGLASCPSCHLLEPPVSPSVKWAYAGACPPGLLGRVKAVIQQVPGMWGASEPLLCLSGDVQLLLLPSELAPHSSRLPSTHCSCRARPSISLSCSSSLRSPLPQPPNSRLSPEMFSC